MRLLLCLILAACTLAGPAFAQDTSVPVAGFWEILRPYVVEVAGILVAAALGWLSMRVNKMFGLSIEAKHREALQSALMNGVMRGLASVDKAADRTSIDLRSAVVAEGVRYVQDYAPDAVRHFKLTPDRLGDLLEARLGSMLQDVPDAA
ncbi:hypothetical protein [Amorphus sp. 3PC139-8]|uniref:hypothetical protein n=1 Tax=Amorphus sp. 3PC139-8 TaxID=2735676 RepID=UPI00345CE6B7